MGKVVDLRGQKFGRLLVVNEAGRAKDRHVLWNCLCECGNYVLVTGNHLKRTGGTLSCGCLQKEKTVEAKTTHGLSSIPEYHIWALMKDRCLNKNSDNFPNYGGRGITVCEQWLKFENFYEDMGQRPNPSLTIERVDNNKGYFPENCIWATKEVQARNTRIHKNNTSGYSGIRWRKRNKKYEVQICVKRNLISLGSFDDIAEAIKARKDGEMTYWQEGGGQNLG